MITKLKITDYEIPPLNYNRQGLNPITSALYRGTYYRNGSERASKQGGFQGSVVFDILRQCYYISTEYGHEPVKAGELLQVWLSAWYHNKEVGLLWIH